MKKLLLLAAILFSIGCGRKCKVEPVEAPKTELIIVNESNSAIVVWVTLGATEGCLQNVSEIPYITDTLNSSVGSFVLEAGDSTIAYAPKGLGFNANLSFNTQPLNCPDSTNPNGVNLFEFVINNYFQAGIPQETIDISCVSGVNSAIKVFLSGGDNWNAGGSYPDVDSIYNVGLIGNSGLVGVYPYGCDTCTGAKSPPSCVTGSSDKQTKSICNVQRDAKKSNNGLIRVVYLGGL